MAYSSRKVDHCRYSGGNSGRLIETKSTPLPLFREQFQVTRFDVLLELRL